MPANPNRAETHRLTNQSRRIRQILASAVATAWSEMGDELLQTPLDHWNESVFRFFVVRLLIRRHPEAVCFTEWNRIDLALQSGGATALVEFKFYPGRVTGDWMGNRVRSKGGAGAKNFGEFCDCVEKLVTVDDAPWTKRHSGQVDAKILVLAYVDRADLVGKQSYRHWYDSIQLPGDCPWADRLHQWKTLRTISIPQSRSSLICKLFVVT